MWSPRSPIPDLETRTRLRADLRAAFALLTRLPVPAMSETDGGARAMWAYPLVGAAVGLTGGALAAILALTGIGMGAAAALGLAAMVLLTGALHEDGLADTADGLGPPGTAERRLEIMRDSRIGAFGAIAITLALLTRWAGLTEAGPVGIIAAATAAGAISRGGLAWLCFQFPMARSDGLAARSGQPPRQTVLISIGIGLAVCLICAGLAGLFVAVLALLAGLPVAHLARHRIGGLTGDVLGAAQQCSEIAALAVLTIVL